MTAFAVIGSGLGDEGKGAAVDAIAASVVAPLVVRANGGAQAGHTVTTPEGRRHIFSHIGSGAFVGAPTYLSRYFVVNPRCFLHEWADLGFSTEVTIDHFAQVTTPYDVLINRWKEQARGDQRHGSVGIGFGETIERAGQGYGLAAGWLFAKGTDVKAALRSTRSYALRRMQELDICTSRNVEQIADDRYLVEFEEEVKLMGDLINVGSFTDAKRGKTLIFENAQGLLLDQTNGFKFPYVSRSNTGLTNIISICESFGINKLNVNYVTRMYQTRHGAGPLLDEVQELEGIKVVDRTNLDKPWQGPLRLAPLMLDKIYEAITRDLHEAGRNSVKLDPGLIVTCWDQVTHELRDPILDKIRFKLPLPIRWKTFGPSRREILKETLLTSNFGYGRYSA